MTGAVGPRNDITDIAGIRVGHHQRVGRGWLTGTTVVVCPPSTVGGVDVRGGGPGTRETDLLAPQNLIQHVHAICLSGGSAYGLAAADGVMRYLAGRNVGFPVGDAVGEVVPIVPAAVLFDLGRGGDFARRPDATFGFRAAARASARRLVQGSVGAGTGAVSGGLRGGVGSASAVVSSGATVAALVVVNSVGSAVDVASGRLHGAALGIGGEFAHLRRPSRSDVRDAAAPVWMQPLNTTLAVIATDADLTKAESQKLAGSAHDGMAVAIRPIHLMHDGDVAFALATGRVELSSRVSTERLAAPAARPAQLNELLAFGAATVARAIAHAMVAAVDAGTVASYLGRYPSARRPPISGPGAS